MGPTEIEKFSHAVHAGVSVPTAADMAGVKAPEAYPDIPGCYVYLLCDPRDESLFYIGKGVRERWKKHLSEYRQRVVQNRTKYTRIGEIVRSGLEPVAYILEAGLSDRDAFALETRMIRAIGFKNLANKMSVGGHSTLLGRVTDLWRRLKPVGVWAKEAPRTERDFEVYWLVYDGLCELKGILEQKSHGTA